MARASGGAVDTAAKAGAGWVGCELNITSSTQADALLMGRLGYLVPLALLGAYLAWRFYFA